METFLFLLELAGTVAFAVSGAVLGIEKHRLLLLGRHRGHEPADAARARHLVRHEQKTGGSRSYPAAAFETVKKYYFLTKRPQSAARII